MSKSGKVRIVGHVQKLEVSPERAEQLRLARIAVLAEKIERLETWQDQGKTVNMKNLASLREKLSQYL